MVSEITSLMGLIITRFAVPSNQVMFFLSILFCFVIGVYAVSVGLNKWSILSCMLIPITFCTILGFIPLLVYITVCAMLSVYLAKIFSGGA